MSAAADDGYPTLQVGFRISTEGSDAELSGLEKHMDAATARIVREAQLIEKATGGMLKPLSGGSMMISTFGAETTRQLESVRKETNRLEKDAERLVRQLEREAATFGKTRVEIKAMDAAAKAARLDDMGLTELSGRLTAANDNLQRVSGNTRALGETNKLAGHHARNLAFQFQDLGVQLAGAAGSSNPLKMAMMAFIQQGPQIQGVMSQAGMSAGGLAKHVGGLAMRFAPLALAAGVAYGALTMVTSSLEDQAGLDAYSKKLGLTKEEMAKLGDVSVTAGDVVKGVWRAMGADKTFEDLIARAKKLWIEFRDTSLSVIKSAAAGIMAAMAAAYSGTMETWRRWPAAIGDVIYRGVNATIAGINALARGANSLLGTDLFGQIKALENPYAGAGKQVAGAYAAAFQREYKSKMAGFDRVGAEIIKASRERIGAAAAKIIAERKDTGGSKSAAVKAAKDAKEAVEREIRSVDMPMIELAVKLNAPDLMVDLASTVFDPWSQMLDRIAQDANDTANTMARAFGRTGSAIGDAAAIMGEYAAERDRIARSGVSESEKEAQNASLQLRSTIGLTNAAKGLFKERTAGYRAMEAAEKALAVLQLARTAVDVAAGAARMFATLGPAGFPAVAAMVGVMASLGFSSGGGRGTAPKTNTGTESVLGDTAAQSESVRRSIDALRDVDTVTMTASREMAASLRSIDGQIGGVAALVARAGGVNASAGVKEGFTPDLLGKGLSAIATGGGLLTKIPVLGAISGAIGGIISGLFGSTSKVVGNGLYAGPQSLGSILGGGFDASYYSDIEKTKKFLGIKTGTSSSTKYTGADAGLEQQFTLILREFNNAIAAAAGPLGVSTSAIEARLSGFVVDLGKIDLKDLTGAEIQEKLSAVFGAAGDRLAAAAIPGLDRFQRVGEGTFETLVRVASTVESVTASLDRLGLSTRALGVDAKVGIAGQFESLSAMQSAVDAYATAFYSKEEQTAASAAQLRGVFTSLGFALPDTLAGFRRLVEAQDLTSAAGQSTYATLLQLAPAFAELQEAMAGAKSAADVLAERQDLQRKLYEVLGDTAAIRALDLAKLDASNRGLQEQIWAVEAAKDAAKAADDLRDAWTGVGTSIADEVKRIRGLSDASGGTSFMAAQGAFNAAIAAARGGDLDVAKSLPGLSQALLAAASDAATSRQELDRVRAQTAAALEGAMAGQTSQSIFDAFTTAAAASPAAAGAATQDDLRSAIDDLRAEVRTLREESQRSNVEVIRNTNRTARVLERVTDASGGDVVNVGRID